MMAFHYIAIASVFNKGQRVAWHYSSERKLNKDKILSFLEKSSTFNNTQFGIHKLSTNSTEWESVYEKDSFFRDILVTSSENEFFKLISEDENIDAMDIASFIISIKPMSHLKLQKILYLTYATFLMKYREALFKDSIVSYRYGPVVDTVYHNFKKYGAEEITDKEKYSFFLKNESMPALYARFSNSEMGTKVINTIVETVNKYDKYTASQLVNITHSENSPWSRSYSENNQNIPITDDVILNYHKNELSLIDN